MLSPDGSAAGWSLMIPSNLGTGLAGGLNPAALARI
jgi:hypothetical protein